jgi:hypothetical protein
VDSAASPEKAYLRQIRKAAGDAVDDLAPLQGKAASSGFYWLLDYICGEGNWLITWVEGESTIEIGCIGNP